jgi:hypothetical protein
MHVYEARCTHCYGTGWSRLPSNGRRGHLATCVVCHGLGEQTASSPSSQQQHPGGYVSCARQHMLKQLVLLPCPRHPEPSVDTGTMHKVPCR